MPDTEFDTYAAGYDAALAEGLSVSGEDKNYFARGRLQWLRRRLDRIGADAANIMDFGCGTGSATPFFRELFPDMRRLVGTDISAASLDVARKEHGSAEIEFKLMSDYRPACEMDLVFCNGVFHHIPLDQRANCIRYIFDALRPGGYFALWENNPWNPGTRYVMSRIPFDREAITLSPPESRRLLRAGGFKVQGIDFLFYFPRILKWFRPLERGMVKLPLGGQYLVLARKPV